MPPKYANGWAELDFFLVRSTEFLCAETVSAVRICSRAQFRGNSGSRPPPIPPSMRENPGRARTYEVIAKQTKTLTFSKKILLDIP
ncbi:unnamed protein product [Clavelina lepadiformis]|uniref:Uncharacterized protein n=1 Tax=Clavelina lepadiformis TaxID=159417 RepID=A0ABP0FJP0_CLALP